MPADTGLLPARGSYALLLHNTLRGQLVYGSRGELQLIPGYYVYIGSAFGPGGIRARVGRHLRHDKTLRWHIDYLTGKANVTEAWLDYSDRRREHRWARTLLRHDDFEAVEGFGCSDCDCRAHLFYCERHPGRLLADLLDGEPVRFRP